MIIFSFSLGGRQGRRNRGGPSFAKCPFSGSKVPFSCVKMSLRLHFLPNGHFWKLESMLFPENVFHFREKYHISWKFFVISGKCFLYLGKNVIYPENYFGISRKIFWVDPPPPKFLDALFLSKSAPQSLAPQLLEASYAPGGRTFFPLNLPPPPPPQKANGLPLTT
jgi:hypothetical protein